MNTIAASPAVFPSTNRISSRAIFRRVLWKEYRVLRPLWVAVFVLTAVVQGLIAAFAPAGADLPQIMFAASLTGAVLFAVGASSILFAAEHEEETHAFLAILPTNWRPLFLGKVLIATILAIALGAALLPFGAAFVGWFDTGPKLPPAHVMRQHLGLFGVAIFEALAWGTLFSLLSKRPLLAALLTIVCGATLVHGAVIAVNQSGMATSDLAAYSEAIPVRVAMIAGAAALAFLAARNWLVPHPACIAPSHSFARSSLPKAPTPITELLGRLRADSHSNETFFRGRMLTRLLWQTWRESWKLLLVPLLMAVFLLLGVGAAIGFLFGTMPSAIFAGATLLFAPALYGSFAFYADQRKASYRFLAEHGARPRYVWFSRHAVWFGALLILLTAITAALSATGVAAYRQQLEAAAGDGDWRWWRADTSMLEQWSALRIFFGASIAAWGGAITAYSTGQFFSMSVRSEILAAFLALLVSPFVVAWVGLLFAWQLSAALFLLPIAAGFFLATWLLAPDWIAGRLTLRSWIGPTIAIAAPAIFIATALPPARLAQLPLTDMIDVYAERSELLPPAPTAEARKTAELYGEAAETYNAWLSSDLLDRWSKPEFMEPLGANGLAGVNHYAGPSGSVSTLGIDPSRIPVGERDAFFAAMAELEEAKIDAKARAIALAVDASERPSCHFDFNWGNLPPSSSARVPVVRYDSRLGTIDPTFSAVLALVDVVAATGDTPAARIDHQLAALRMLSHLRENQPSAVAIKLFQHERDLLDQIAEWAAGPDISQEDRKTLLERLTSQFAVPHSPAQAFIADRELIRAAILGTAAPAAFTDEADLPAQLAYLANEFPWERQRSLRAIDLLIARDIRRAHECYLYLAGESPHPTGQTPLFELTSPEAIAGRIDPFNPMTSAAATSYFAMMEYDARVAPNRFFRTLVDNEAARRAARLRIALAMYLADHGKYPAQLDDLVPDYFAELPLDPYNNRPFNYSPRGLDLPWVRSQYNPADLIPAHTPLLWSIGHAGLSAPTRIGVPVPNVDELQTQLVYALIHPERLWYVDFEPALVFPLPRPDESP